MHINKVGEGEQIIMRGMFPPTPTLQPLLVLLKNIFQEWKDENIMQPICSIHKTHNIFFFPNERSEGIVL